MNGEQEGAAPTGPPLVPSHEPTVAPEGSDQHLADTMPTQPELYLALTEAEKMERAAGFYGFMDQGGQTPFDEGGWIQRRMEPPTWVKPILDGRQPVEYVTMGSWGDHRPPTTFGGVPVTPGDRPLTTPEMLAMMTPMSMGQGLPVRTVFPRFEGETQEEVYQNAVSHFRRGGGTLLDEVEQGRIMVGATTLADFASFHLASLVPGYVDARERAYQSLIDRPWEVQSARNQADALLLGGFRYTPPGILLDKFLMPKAAAILERVAGPLARSMSERVMQKLEQSPPFFQPGSTLTQPVRAALEAGNAPAARWQLFDYFARKMGDLGRRTIPPSIVRSAEYAVDAAQREGVLFRELPNGVVSVEIPTAASKAVVESLRQALGQLKSSVVSAGGAVTFRLIGKTAPRLLAPAAGLGVLGTMQGASVALEPGLTPEQRREALQAAPGVGLHTAALGLPTAIAAALGALPRHPAAATATAPGSAAGARDITPPKLLSGRVLGGALRAPTGGAPEPPGPPISNTPLSRQNVMLPRPTTLEPGEMAAVDNMAREVENVVRTAPEATAQAVAQTWVGLLGQAYPPDAQTPPGGPGVTAFLGRAQALADLALQPGLERAAPVLGADPRTLLYNPVLTPGEERTWPLVRWAVALAERGLPAEILTTLPPFDPANPHGSLVSRLGQAAINALRQNPSAAVGPPAEAQLPPGSVPEGVLRSGEAPLPRTPGTASQGNLPLGQIPDEDEARTPEGLRAMQGHMAQLAQGHPHVYLGSLNPENLAVLGSQDPIGVATEGGDRRDAVPVVLEDGLLKALIEDEHGEAVLIDITHSLEPIRLPLEGDWKWQGSLLAPFGLKQTEDGRLVLDAEDAFTSARRGNQEFIRTQLADALGIRQDDPWGSPGSLLQHVLEMDPQAHGAGLRAAAERAAELGRAHAAAKPPLRDATALTDLDEVESVGADARAWLFEGAKLAAAEAVAREKTGPKGPPPATFLGFMQHMDGTPFGLWNLTEDIEGHPRYSTVTTATLEAAGFEPVEPPPVPGLVALARVPSEGGEERASVGLDPRFIAVMGGNLYSGDLGKIAVKEMIQNAKDSVQARVERKEPGYTPEVKVRVYWEDKSKGPTIQTEDNGIGMSPSVATEELMNVGGSYKPSTESTGGFGFAKVAIFANAEHIDVYTNDGSTVTQLTGSGTDWADSSKGLLVQSRPTAAEDSRGTRITTRLRGDVRASWFEIASFLRWVDKNNLSNVKMSFSGAAPYSPGGEGPLKHEEQEKPLLHIEDLQIPGAVARIYTSEDTIEGFSTPYVVLGRGLPQFESYFGMQGTSTLPRAIVVDILPLASPEEPDYPFRPDREGLREGAKRAIERFIREKIVKVLIERTGHKLQEAFRSSPIIPGYPDVAPDGVILDPTVGHDQEQIKTLATTLDYRQVHTLLTGLTNTIRQGLLTAEVGGKHYGDPTTKEIRYVYAGLTLGAPNTAEDHFGIAINRGSIPGYEEMPHGIYLNPWAHALAVEALLKRGFLQDPLEAAQQLARRLAATAIHEYTHEQAWGHDESFSGFLTQNMTAAWDPNVEQAVVDFGAFLAAGDLFKRIVDDAKSLTAAYRSGTDLYGKISASAGAQTPPPPGTPGDPTNPTGGPSSGSGLGQGIPGPRGGAAQGVGPASTTRRRGPAELAKMRALALEYAAANGSFSRRPDLFEVLTPDEKFYFLFARIAHGDFAPKHWAQFNPTQWGQPKRGWPRYFKDWRPTPDQRSALVRAYQARTAGLSDASRALIMAQDIATKRDALRKVVQTSKDATKAASAQRDLDELPLIPLDDLLKIPRSELIRARDTNPNLFRELTAQFNREHGGLTVEPADEAALHILEDTFTEMLTSDDIEGRQAPPADLVRARGLLSREAPFGYAKASVRKLGRPWSVIGGGNRQITHPIEWKQALDQGLMENSTYFVLSRGWRKMQDEKVAVNDELRPLLNAIDYNLTFDSKSRTFTGLGTKISALLHRALNEGWTPERLASLEASGEVPIFKNVKTATLGYTTVKLSEWVPRIRSLRDRLWDGASKEVVADLRQKTVDASHQLLRVKAEMRTRVLQRAQEMGRPANEVSDLDPITKEAIFEALRGADDGSPSQAGLTGLRFRELEKQMKSRQRAVAALRRQADEFQRGKGYVEAYTPWLYNEVRQLLQTEADPWLTQLARRRPDIRNHFLKPRDFNNPDQPIEDWAYTNEIYNHVMLRYMHLQPALRKALRLAADPTYPESQRQYVQDLAARLKGVQSSWDMNIDRMMSRELLLNPSVRKAISETVYKATGGRRGANVQKAITDYGREMVVPDRPNRTVTKTLVPQTYGLYLFGPLVSMFNVVEGLAGATTELARRPAELAYGMWWLPKNATRAIGENIGEESSRLWGSVFGTTPYRSRATINHVNDLIYESGMTFRESMRQAEETGDKRAALTRALVGLYLKLSGVGATEALSRNFHFNLWKDRARWHGLTEADAEEEAAVTTGYILNNFHDMAQSPTMQGSVGRLGAVLMRYNLTRSGYIGSAARSAAELVMPRPDPSRWAEPGADPGGSPPPPQGPAPPPTDIPGIGDPWDAHPEELPLWESAPPAPFGVSYPAEQIARWRGLFLLLGVVASLGGISFPMGKAIFRMFGRSTQGAWDYTDPLYWRNATTLIQGLIGDMSLVLHVNMGRAMGAQASPRALREYKGAQLRVAAFLGTMSIVPWAAPITNILQRTAKQPKDAAAFSGGEDEAFAPASGGEGFSEQE